MTIGDRIGRLTKRRPLQEGVARAKKARDKLPVRPIPAIKKGYHSVFGRVREATRAIRDLHH